MIRLTTVLLLLPAAALAESMPTYRSASGVDATSARVRLERGSLRPYGPRFEAGAMPLASAVEHFPGLRLPGQTAAFHRNVPAIRVVKPAFHLPEQQLGIADTQDVVFFTDTRLVRFRLHLSVSGEPLAKRWSRQLRTYFDFLDRDGNGELNRHETVFAFANAGVVQMLQTGFAYQRPDDAARAFADLDQDEDGKVSFDEFAAYYAPSASRVIAAESNQSPDVYGAALTDELVKQLDADKDGRLSRAELQSADRLWDTLDADEDECLTALEILPDLFTRPVRTTRVPTVPDSRSTMAFPPGQAPESLVRTILVRYDFDRDQRLDRNENPFGDDAFRALDRDGDGGLTATELASWADLPPDLQLDMTLGDRPEDCQVRLRPAADGKPAPQAGMFRPAGDGMAIVIVGNRTIQLDCLPPRATPTQVGRPAMLAFPDGGRGFITEKDLPGPQFQLMRVMFDLIDRDADERVTRSEYDRFVKLQSSFTSLPLSLGYAVDPQSLFHVLDRNGDGRLTRREVRTAWDRLIGREPVEKEHVTLAAFTPLSVVRFGRTIQLRNANPSTLYSQPVGRAPERGPVWFRKFDRNGDGELSRKEFPGSPEAFDRLDADGDGYITFEEAEAADRTLRPKK